MGQFFIGRRSLSWAGNSWDSLAGGRCVHSVVT